MPNLTKRAILMISAFAFAVGAKAAPFKEPKPDWVDGSSVEYPRDKYLVGVGFADDRPTAEDRARAEISKIFSTQVSVNTNVSASETDATHGQKADNSFSQAVSVSLQTASQNVLQAVSIVETWQDESSQRYYALAVLDRDHGLASMKEKISELDRQTLQWKDKLDKTTEKFQKVQYGMKLLALLKVRDQLNSQYQVLDPGGKGIPSSVDGATVQQQAAKALADLDVQVSATGDGAERMETGIIGGLNKLGLEAKTGDENEPADILVEARVQQEILDDRKQDGWQWVRATVTVSLKDITTDKIFLRFDLSERQASASRKEAVRRALAKVSGEVAQKIQQGITAYFENQ